MTNKNLENKIDKLLYKDYSIYRKNLYSNDLVDEIKLLILSNHLHNDRKYYYKSIKSIHDQLYKMFS